MENPSRKRLKIFGFGCLGIFVLFVIISAIGGQSDNTKTSSQISNSSTSEKTVLSQTASAAIQGLSSIQSSTASISLISSTSTSISSKVVAITKKTVWDILNDRPIVPLSHNTITEFAESFKVRESKEVYSTGNYGMTAKYEDNNYILTATSIVNSDDLNTFQVEFKNMGKCKTSEVGDKIEEAMKHIGFENPEISSGHKLSTDGFYKANLSLGFGSVEINLSCWADGEYYTYLFSRLDKITKY